MHSTVARGRCCNKNVFVMEYGQIKSNTLKISFVCLVHLVVQLAAS